MYPYLFNQCFVADSASTHAYFAAVAHLVIITMHPDSPYTCSVQSLKAGATTSLRVTGLFSISTPGSSWESVFVGRAEGEVGGGHVCAAFFPPHSHVSLLGLVDLCVPACVFLVRARSHLQPLHLPHCFVVVCRLRVCNSILHRSRTRRQISPSHTCSSLPPRVLSALTTMAHP